MKVKDHKGNEYKSINSMHNAYGISSGTYYYRLNKGMSLKEILETPLMKSKTYYDHLGNEYNSLEDMCYAYKISKSAYKYRIKAGWNLKDILLTKVRGSAFKDIVEDRQLDKGNSTPGVTFEKRLKARCSEKASKITTRPKRKGVEDHKGNHYNTVEEMCDAYNTTPNTFYRKIMQGYSVEDALNYRVRYNYKHRRLDKK